MVQVVIHHYADVGEAILKTVGTVGESALVRHLGVVLGELGGEECHDRRALLLFLHGLQLDHLFLGLGTILGLRPLLVCLLQELFQLFRLHLLLCLLVVLVVCHLDLGVVQREFLVFPAHGYEFLGSLRTESKERVRLCVPLNSHQSSHERQSSPLYIKRLIGSLVQIGGL